MTPDAPDVGRVPSVPAPATPRDARDVARDVATGPAWPVDDAPVLSPLQQNIEAEGCVVGLGAAGLAAVAHLLDRGRSVVGIDAAAPGEGASGRNGGFLLAGTAAFHHEAVRALGPEGARRIYRLTLDELDSVAAAHPEAVRRVGSLRIAADEEELADCRAHLAALRGDGFAAEEYDGPEGAGLLLPDDAAFDPATRVHDMLDAATRRGARLFGGTRATRVAPGVLETDHDVTIRADVILVAVDGGLEQLVPSLQGRVRTARAQMLATAPAHPAARLGDRPVYRRYGYDYHQQLPDGRVVLGGFRDRAGPGEWTTDATPTAAVQAMLDDFLRHGLRVTAPVTHRWAGLIGFTADRLPAIHPADAGVVACGGYGGTGNLLGPIAARAGVDLLLDGHSRTADLLRSACPPHPPDTADGVLLASRNHRRDTDRHRRRPG